MRSQTVAGNRGFQRSTTKCYRRRKATAYLRIVRGLFHELLYSVLSVLYSVLAAADLRAREFPHLNLKVILVS
jgi:hypothetical protein